MRWIRKAPLRRGTALEEEGFGDLLVFSGSGAIGQLSSSASMANTLQFDSESWRKGCFGGFMQNGLGKTGASSVFHRAVSSSWGRDGWEFGKLMVSGARSFMVYGCMDGG